MPVIRIVLLLVVLGGLTLLLAQNWSPVLPLVFLGMRTQALPLAVWILSAVSAGAFTSLLIAGLFKLSNYFASGQPRTQRLGVKAAQRSSSTQRSSDASSANSRPMPETNSTPNDTSDWDTNPTDDDWDFDEDTDKSRNDPQNTVRDSTTYEVNTEPKSGSRSGSVYSYSYREPKNSSVGKTEFVYDADYRVIAPPHRQTEKAQEDDDWGFDDDDDFDDEGETDSPSSRR